MRLVNINPKGSPPRFVNMDVALTVEMQGTAVLINMAATRTIGHGETYYTIEAGISLAEFIQRLQTESLT